MRAPLIIALAATLVGCSREPPRQAAAEACTDEREFACSNRTAADQPIRLAPFKTNPPTKSARFTVAAKSEKPQPHRVHDRAHLATKKAVIAAKADLPTTSVPPPSLATQPEPKSNAT